MTAEVEVCVRKVVSVHRKPHEVQEIARVLCTASAAVLLLRLLLLLLYFESTMLGVGGGCVWWMGPADVSS